MYIGIMYIDIMFIGIMYINIMYIGIHEKYPLFLLDFNEIRIFSTDFRNILMTDMTKVLSRFSHFCESA